MVLDILQKVFTIRKNGGDKKAFNFFEKIMPQIFFSLQKMELFHYPAKEFLMTSEILPKGISRRAVYKTNQWSINYIRELNKYIVELMNSEVNSLQSV